MAKPKSDLSLSERVRERQKRKEASQAKSTRDLWPDDIKVDEMVTPLSILKEQASLLGQKTQNLVEAEVQTKPLGADFSHSFFLVAPPLDNYRYKLFEIHHPIDMYPVKIVDENGGIRYEPRSQDEFIAKLREVLTSEKTKSVIRALIAQSQN